MRKIAIGDIHGCSKALRALVEAIRPQRTDTLIFLGDYIDRGPDSRGTIDYLLTLHQFCNPIFLRGNHEVAFQGYLSGLLPPEVWFQLGGKSTLVSFGGRNDCISQRHRDFIQDCIAFYEDDSNIFVHAHYDPNLALSETPDRILYWEHLLERVPGPQDSKKTVWLGHTPQLTGEVLDLGYLVCLDTFCFGTGYLTAMDVATREKWQVSKEGHLRRATWPWIRAMARWLRSQS